MLGSDHAGAAAVKQSFFSRKTQTGSSSSLKTIPDWATWQGMASDMTVRIGEAIFNLHKLPLASRSGYIRKLVSQSNDGDDSGVVVVDMPDMPGGAEAFELVVSFCYGVNFQMTEENVAMLRCAAEHLEMTEKHAAGNLVCRAEAYLEEVALKTLAGAVAVLHKCENLMPVAERVKLVGQSIDALAFIICSDSQLGLSLGVAAAGGRFDSTTSTPQRKAIGDWWAEELTVLRIDFFQRVMAAIRARGFRAHALGPLIMLYAQKSLRSLDIYGRGKKKKIEPKEEHEKRVILESIVNLLPRERNSISVSFLSMLLRAALYLETTVACRLDLEKRIAQQLGQAVLEDLMIPSFSVAGETLLDVDTVQRVFVNYLEQESESFRGDCYTDDDLFSLPSTDMRQVGKLMESYLAEIASDGNLTVEKFVGFAELIPEHAKFSEDGMYRAIDIYLKVHATVSDGERKTICSLMDCQKLSREACAHAAQNDRLPAQTVVQVLHYEQQRLREYSMGSGYKLGGGDHSPAMSYKTTPLAGGGRTGTLEDTYSVLQRENDELRLELLKLKLKMDSSSSGGTPAAPQPAAKPPLAKRSFMDSMAKKLGRLNPFARSISAGRPTRPPKPPKDRRHSIS